MESGDRLKKQVLPSNNNMQQTVLRVASRAGPGGYPGLGLTGLYAGRATLKGFAPSFKQRPARREVVAALKVELGPRFGPCLRPMPWHNLGFERTRRDSGAFPDRLRAMPLNIYVELP